MENKIRRELTSGISLPDFQRSYWLKEELISFCRNNGLPSSGSKQKLTSIVAHYLETGEIHILKNENKVNRYQMPDELTLQTIIQPGFRCSQKLRAFFEKEIGKSFHFNGIMRDFISKDGIGKTLGDAVNLWQEDKTNPKKEKEIGVQFEYNRHIREYFSIHKNASLKDAISAWNSKKQDRNK